MFIILKFSFEYLVSLNLYNHPQKLPGDIKETETVKQFKDVNIFPEEMQMAHTEFLILPPPQRQAKAMSVPHLVPFYNWK